MGTNVTQSVTIPLTPEIVAEWFAGTYDHEQAEMLSLLEDKMNALGTFLRDSQLIFISKLADTKARNFVFRLANWFKAKDLDGQQWKDAIEHYPEAQAHEQKQPGFAGLGLSAEQVDFLRDLESFLGGNKSSIVGRSFAFMFREKFPTIFLPGA